MTARNSYEELRETMRDTAYIGSAMAVLHWDQRTQIPHKGHPHRAGQLSTLTKMIHRRVTDPRIGDLLSHAEHCDLTSDPLSVEAVNIREWRRSYDRMTKVPEKLAVELARVTSESQSLWERARPKNDWDVFKPYLKRVVELKREYADAVGYEREPYDALLDDYERGETAAALEPLFAELRTPLVDLVDRVKGSERGPSGAMQGLVFPIAEQQRFALEAAQRIGYDMEGGRLDISAHPFTTGIGPGDVRITARYSEDFFNEGFYAVLHEAGHALYHQGLPMDYWGEPFCRPISLGVNESQSRLWENLVGRSRAFWEFHYPLARERFRALSTVSLDDFLFAINKVTPSLIRVEADEVTYNLHVLLRFELELGLTRGEIDVDDLPEAWNDKMEAHLGLTPPDYASGVMQDVHWASGAIGYFPTYTLGNIYSAQIFDRAGHDLEDLDGLFVRGEYEPLLRWMREHIHTEGSRYFPRDLVKRACGADPDSRFLVEYLRTKCAEYYGV